MVYKAVICERILLSFQVKIFLRDVVEYGDMVFWAQKKKDFKVPLLSPGHLFNYDELEGWMEETLH